MAGIIEYMKLRNFRSYSPTDALAASKDLDPLLPPVPLRVPHGAATTPVTLPNYDGRANALAAFTPGQMINAMRIQI